MDVIKLQMGSRIALIAVFANVCTAAAVARMHSIADFGGDVTRTAPGRIFLTGRRFLPVAGPGGVFLFSAPACCLGADMVTFSYSGQFLPGIRPALSSCLLLTTGPRKKLFPRNLPFLPMILF